MANEDHACADVLWGEVIDEDLSNEKEGELTLPSLCPLENVLIHTPSAKGLDSKKESKKSALWMKAPTDHFGQNFILHSIDLQHYKRRMRYMLAAAHSHQTELMKGGSAENASLPFPPPPPKRFCSASGRVKIPQHSCSCFKINNDEAENSCEIHKDNSKPTTAYSCPVNLDSFSARQLSLRAVAGITAFSGFENANETAIHTLTDVFVEHMLKMCRLFKIHKDKKQTSTQEETLAALAHTLKEFGITDILMLQDHWENNMKQATIQLEQESLDLLNEYNSLKESIGMQKNLSN